MFRNSNVIHIFSIFLVIAAIVLLKNSALFSTSAPNEVSNAPQIASVLPSVAENSAPTATSSSITSHASSSNASSSPIVKKAPNKAIKTGSPQPKKTLVPDQIERVQNPYSTPAIPFNAINTFARSALVNILCQPSGGTLRPISGSGVIIDPRGVILTNAHVAQYVLLSESTDIDLKCYIRSGSPARAQWIPKVLFMPSIWVDQHVSEINTQEAKGTGEHDYALLLITDSIDGSQLPATFPYISPDTREAIAFASDPVLVATYPAEFIGGIAAQMNMFSVSTVTTIRQLLTFSTTSVDLVSVGGIIEAQSGSSGGAVVNAWNRLVGIIVTTSAGATTAERDLRAVTISYVNRDLQAQSGLDLGDVLSRNVSAEMQAFSESSAPLLIASYVQQLLKTVH